MATQPEIVSIPQEHTSGANNNSSNASSGNVPPTYVVLAPLVYQGAVPKPSEACADPLPEEQLRLNNEQKQRALAAKEQEVKSSSNAPAAPPASSGSTADTIANTASGWFSSIKSAAALIALNVEKTTHDVSTATEDKLRQMDNQRNFDRFRTNFPSLVAQGEVLLADYGCSAVHGGQVVNGHLQITRHYMCFTAQTTNVMTQAADRLRTTMNENTGGKVSAPAAKVEGIRDAIPLSTVASLQRCVTLPKVEQQLPYFLPLPDPAVVPTALQVYVPDGNRVFQFFHFDSITSKAGVILSDNLKGTPLDRAYCYLDHAWRECVTVPLEGVEYAS